MTQESSPSVAFHRSAARRALLFGPFRFDLSDKTLTRDGQEIRLPPRALMILDYLIERPGRIVTRQELADAVWKDAFVSESSLTEAIGVLRQALGDSAAEAEYIQTVHRRGYRFVASLRVDAPASPPLVPVTMPVPDPAALPEAPVAAGSESGRASWRRPVVAASVAAVALAAVIATWMTLSPGADAPVTRATITLPVAQAPAPGLTAQPIAALSPDGRQMVYVAGAPGSYRLFLRAIDQFEAVPVPGTDGAHGPFFSPDGRSIGYFANGRLYAKVLPDGQPIDLAAAGFGDGGAWHTDGTIIYATGTDDGLYRIPSTGGERRPVLLNGVDGTTLRHPVFLGDGRTILATAWKDTVRHSQVVSINLDSGVATTIGRGVHPRGLPDGRVAYLRDGDLVAAPASGAGPEVTLISGVMTGVTGAGQYSLAANGTLLYVPDAPERMLRRIIRISNDGREESLLFDPRPYQNVALSPDGTRIVATIYERGASDLWLGDIDRGVFRRLTFEGGTIDPVWSPDSSHIYFAWTRNGTPHVYRMLADGSAPATIVSSESSVTPSFVTADGTVFANLIERGRVDIIRIAADGTTRAWRATAAPESSPSVSPDGRYVAYMSSRSGRQEIYVLPIDGGAEQQVSVNGGVRPGWRSDSGAILFTSNRHLYRADLRDGRLSRPVEIYANPRMVFSRPAAPGNLALAAIEEERPLTTLNLIVGWTSEVKRVR
jgi:Tol biopolymer transport system component/DNA-binding winged helix-turn-helix (wHTH) protein